MNTGETGIERVARSAFAVLRAGHDLSDTRDYAAARSEAAGRLAATIEYRLADLSRVDASAFAPPGDGPAASPEPPGEILGLIAAQLRIGEVALAAQAVADGAAPGDAGGLDEALAGLRTTVGALESGGDAAHQGFAPQRRGSPDVATAAAVFRRTADETLEAMTKRTVDALTRPLRTLGGLAPEAASRAWEQINDRLQLDHLGSRLIQAGLRAVAAALGALRRLVRADWLETVRGHLTGLADQVAADGAALAAVAGLLGVAGISAETAVVAGRPGLEIVRLDTASDALAVLAGEFGGAMDMVALAQTAVAGLGAVTVLGLAVPHLAAVLVGAELALGAVVVALALDYVDTLPSAGWVRGVRTIVRKVVPSA